MESSANAPNDAPAIMVRTDTDLVDEARRRIVVLYPNGVIDALVVSGIVAFVCAGYLGYPDDPPIIRILFRLPWPLYLWLLFLVMFLYVSILRQVRLRGALTFTLIATLSSTMLLLFAWSYGWIGLYLRWITSSLGALISSVPVLIALVGVGALLGACLRFTWGRYVLAVLLILLSTTCFVAGSHFSANYLHTASQATTGDQRVAFGRLLVIWLLAFGFITAGLVVAVASCTVLVFRLRVLSNSVQFLALLLVVVYVYLPVFAILNSFLWLTGFSYRTPFFEPTVGGMLTLVVFVVSLRSRALKALYQLTGRTRPELTDQS